MDPGGLRRKDTTKGPPLRVLSLDGGGVRGYSMLILLQELMYKTYNEVEGKPPTREQIPKPCDYFDLIAGTGTGGLIAIMLGRLRMDLETCKNVYVRMTKRVFETDKTFAGVPYRSTLFKASKLEEAIRECVREHTADEGEGNDGTPQGGIELPMSPASSAWSDSNQRKSMASSVRSGFDPVSPRSVFTAMHWGNPNAYLYDARENRTKTAVTAVFQGTRNGGEAVLLRSYDSRKEPAPEFNVTIWQAARATAAIAMAFKAIQVGQSVFIDEGSGKYNPSPQILDEAIVNEWPGRELGVLVSIGTGKRPSGTSHKQSEWWEGFIGGSMGRFADARRRLIAKIEGCEETHQYMLKEHLAKRKVGLDRYYRLNVEVGVGEFGMNEWDRLADISTSTRRYLSKPEVKQLNEEAAMKLARIERQKRRAVDHYVAQGSTGSSVAPPLGPVIELPGDEGRAFQGSGGRQPHRDYSGAASGDKFTVVGADDFPPSPGGSSAVQGRPSGESWRSGDVRLPIAPAPLPRRSHESQPGGAEAPPLPPKTPIEGQQPPHPAYRPPPGSQPPLRPNSHPPPRSKKPPPYPDDDGPPPLVNMAAKPVFVPRDDDR